MKNLVLVGMLATVLLAGKERSHQALKGDTKKLQGTWMVLVNESKDSKTGEESNARQEYRVIIEGDRLTWKSLRTEDTVTFRVDSTKTPKTLDLDLHDGKPNNLCIYELEGDNLKICIGHFGRRRPSGFDVSKRPGASLLTFMRKEQ
jgi:uncharacterized protein (TIGR03067 family)